MTITEAAACGTPAVATRIAGHADAIVDGVTGLLVDDRTGLVTALDRVLARRRVGALRSATPPGSTHVAITWAATATGTLEVLAAEAASAAAREDRRDEPRHSSTDEHERASPSDRTRRSRVGYARCSGTSRSRCSRTCRRC